MVFTFLPPVNRQYERSISLEGDEAYANSKLKEAIKVFI